MQKKYTLPRHTNLANTATRVGAFLIDFAIAFALFLIFFYGVSLQIYQFNGRYDLYTKMQDYTLESGLCYLKEEADGSKSVAIYDTSTDYEIFVEPISEYYLCYLTGNREGQPIAPNYNEPIKLDDGSEVLPKDYYTVAWYNYNILGITEDDPDRETSSLYFTYQKDAEGNYDKTKIGTNKTSRYNPDVGKVVELTASDITYQYKVIYQAAYRHLESQNFYQAVSFVYDMGNNICVVSSIILSGAIVYIVMPLIFKNGQTVGKKILKLGLANYEGYSFKNIQLAMRFMPFFVTSCAFFLPIWNNFLVVSLVALVIFLVSFALFMASPKKASLHDLAARTIVIDMKTSIIFDNFILEEEYIAKEDNLPKEIIAGEEPELKYEK